MGELAAQVAGAAAGEPKSRDYVVVMRNLGSSTHRGVLTWSVFDDKADFDRWYAGTMQDGSNQPLNEVYEIVAEGVTDEEAVAIVSSPEGRHACEMAELRVIGESLGTVAGTLEQVLKELQGPSGAD